MPVFWAWALRLQDPWGTLARFDPGVNPDSAHDAVRSVRHVLFPMLPTFCHPFSRSLWRGLLAVALTAGTMSVHARTSADSDQVALATLPAEGQSTYARILQGGPFPYEKDGTVFFNRERLLPVHKRGYYREYTVAKAGSRNRGARRIVCGGLRPAAPEGCYYTSDHYASFRKIAP